MSRHLECKRTPTTPELTPQALRRQNTPTHQKTKVSMCVSLLVFLPSPMIALGPGTVRGIVFMPASLEHTPPPPPPPTALDPGTVRGIGFWLFCMANVSLATTRHLLPRRNEQVVSPNAIYTVMHTAPICGHKALDHGMTG